MIDSSSEVYHNILHSYRDCADSVDLLGEDALHRHFQAESERANFIKEISNNYNEQFEKELLGCKYRVSVLRNIVAKPFSHKFHYGKRSGVTVHIPALTIGHRITSKHKNDLIDIMVDTDILAWHHKKKIYTKSDCKSYLNGLYGVRKRKQLTDDIKEQRERALKLFTLGKIPKDTFNGHRRGLWNTAVKNFVAKFLSEMSTFPPAVNVDAAANNSTDDTNEATIALIPTCDDDVASVISSDIDQSSVHPMSNTTLNQPICSNCQLDSNPMIECAALMCKDVVCCSCLKARLKVTELPDDITHYCTHCAKLVARWEEIGYGMTEKDAAELRRKSMDITTNDEANIWHFYLNKLKSTILPPSLHPGMLLNPKYRDLHIMHPNIQLMKNTCLKKDRARARREFTCISPKVQYQNELQGRDLGKLTKGYDSSSIYSLKPAQKEMLNYILGRADNSSCCKLVCSTTKEHVYSVKTTRFIPKGTWLLEYGGMLFFDFQLPPELIGDSSASITWILLQHREDESKSVYIYPKDVSNYGRYINSVRSDELRLANITIMKVKDSMGCIRVGMIAVRDIKEGEHLLYYYGDEYDTSDFLSVEQLIQHEWRDV